MHACMHIYMRGVVDALLQCAAAATHVLLLQQHKHARMHACMHALRQRAAAATDACM